MKKNKKSTNQGHKSSAAPASEEGARKETNKVESDDDEEHAMAQLREMITKIVDEKVDKKIEDQKSEIAGMKTELTDIKSENVKLKRLIQKLQFQLSKKDEDIEVLEAEIDDMKQQQLQNNVRVIGLDENGNDTEDIQKFTHKNRLVTLTNLS